MQDGVLSCGAGAAAALCNLAEGSPENQAAICQANALDKFPRLLQGGLTSSGLIIEVPSPAMSAACVLGVWLLQGSLFKMVKSLKQAHSFIALNQEMCGAGSCMVRTAPH